MLNKKEKKDVKEVYQKRIKNLLMLQEVSTTITGTLDLEETTQKIVDVVVKDLGYVSAVLYLVDQKEKIVQGYTVSQTPGVTRVLKRITKDFKEHKATIKGPKYLHNVAKTAATGEIIIGEKARDFVSPTLSTTIADFAQRVTRMRSFITIPLRMKGTITGVLMFNSGRESFSEEEITTLKIFSAQASVAVENARLYDKVTTFNTELKQKVDEATKEIQIRNRDLVSMRKITDVINSNLDIKKISQEIVDNIISRLNFVSGLITLVDKQKKELYPVAVSRTPGTETALRLVGRMDRFRISIEEENNLATMAVKNRKSYTTDDLADILCPPINPSIARRMQKVNQIKGGIVVPIIAQERVLGVMAIALDKPSAKITSRERDTIATLANEAGLAMNNALLFERTERFNVELKEEVERATKDLRQANKKLTKLDIAKTEFISIASHQLRTPLSTIKGYLSMILDGDYGIISEPAGQALVRVYNSNEHLIDLVNNLLNLSRIEGGQIDFQPKPIQLTYLIDDVIGELVQVSKKCRVQILFKKPLRLPRDVLADERLMHEILINLLDNAIKYSPNGQVTISLRKRRRSLEVWVKDTGIGLTADDKQRLFKKFTRGHDSYKVYTGGSGLGLYLVKTLVKMHGGDIKAESKGKNKGSTFKFTVPYA
ncbi:ATP-binding protein [Patescibacteria group bacterium]